MTVRSQPRLRARAGFTLSELLIALTLTAVVGAAVTTLFVSQNRYFEQQEKLGESRDVSRNAMNVIMSELRMIEQDSGVIAATDSVIELRVPFGMGVICDTIGSVVTGLLMPVGAPLYADAVLSYAGYMVRPLNSTQYTYVAKTADPILNAAGASAICTAKSFNPGAVSGVQTVVMAPFVSGTAAPRFPFMLYNTVTYRFAESQTVPGRIGLYRQTGSMAAPGEELVAPFASTAGFRFYAGNEHQAAQDAPPADLSTLLGVQLVLDGISERPNSDGTYMSVPLSTSVFFKNRK